MSSYSLYIQINTRPYQYAQICCFQRNPGAGATEVMSLAWLLQPIASLGPNGPNAMISFGWQTTPCFIWGETGPLKPGITFGPSQVANVDINGTEYNKITLGYRGFYEFVGQDMGGEPGTLSIAESREIPANMLASVGIGMSGTGTFIAQATAGANLVFSGQPEYWLAAGNFSKGEVLAAGAISNSVQVVFPQGVFQMEATLNADSTWTLQYD